MKTHILYYINFSENYACMM